MNRQLASPALVVLTALSIGHGFYADLIPAWYPALFAWLAGALLVSTLATTQRIQAFVLFSLGAIALTIAGQLGADLPLVDALAINQGIIGMFVAVSFLRVISRAALEDNESLPTGRGALLRTLFGTSAFASVINFSAFSIITERIVGEGRMTRLQALTMSRAFASAAMWSPFFVAMAVSLTYAPGAQLSTLMTVGIPMWIISLAIGAGLMLLDPKSDEYVGYPMHANALILPVTLATLVLSAHFLMPEIAILTIVSLFSLLITVVVSITRRGRSGLGALTSHVKTALPSMGGEVVMFLAAGVFAIGISAIATATNFSLPFNTYGAREASIVILSITLVSAMGLHPIVSVSVLGGLLLPLDPEPGLLGTTFLMSWALGTSISPVSIIHLTLQGGYGLNVLQCMRWNLPFTGAIFLVCVAVLHLYERWASL